MRDSSSLGACGVSGDGDRETLIDLSETPISEKETLNFADLLTGYPPTDKEAAVQNLQRYTQLLLSGRKKVNAFIEVYFILNPTFFQSFFDW